MFTHSINPGFKKAPFIQPCSGGGKFTMGKDLREESPLLHCSLQFHTNHLVYWVEKGRWSFAVFVQLLDSGKAAEMDWGGNCWEMGLDQSWKRRKTVCTEVSRGSCLALKIKPDLVEPASSCSCKAHLTLELGWEVGCPGWGEGCGWGGGSIGWDAWVCWTGEGEDIMVMLLWLTWNKRTHNCRQERAFPK